MSLTLTRQIHFKRLPNYNGWWTQILNQARDPVKQSSLQEQVSKTRHKVPLPIPFAEIVEPTQPIITTNAQRPKVFVHLKGTPIELAEKPDPPENCCMSGCAHCVWDMYQEDMEDYSMRKKEIRRKFVDAGEPLPKELDSSDAVDVLEEIDPAIKAFLEMEKKLNSK